MTAVAKKSPLVLDPADYQAIEVDFYIENQSTKTKIRNKKPQGTVKKKRAEIYKLGPIEILELIDQGIILSIPPACCASGQILILEMTAKTPDGKEASFHGTAKVSEAENQGDTGDRVILRFTQYDPESLQRFMALFLQRQEEIEKFFSSVKGY